MNKPIIGITMGDPAGIGTEIIGKAFTDKMIYEICNPVLIGDKNATKSLDTIREIRDSGKEKPEIRFRYQW